MACPWHAGDRHVVDCRPQVPQPGRRSPAHAGIDLRFGVGVLEPFLHHSEAQALYATVEGLGVGMGFDIVLPGIIPVCSGNDFEQQGIVTDGIGHRPGVVDGNLDRHDTGIGHQAVRWFHAVNATIG